MKLERNADGSAKLIYEPKGTPPAQSGTDKAYTPVAITLGANSTTGGDYLVKTFQFNAYQARYAKSVVGLKADTVTSVAKNSPKALEISSDKLILADQYSNNVTSDDNVFNKAISGGAVVGTMSTTGTSIYVVSRGAIDVAVTDNKIIATPAAVGSATVYMKYHYEDAQGAVTPVQGATNKDYDARFTISVYDTSDVDVSTLEIKSVNNGFAVKPENASGTALKDVLKVVTKIGGVETEIPGSQYEIIDNKNNQFTQEEINKGVKSKTATVTVQVTTWDSTNTDIPTPVSKDYQVSVEDEKLYKVDDMVSATSDGAINISGGALTVDAGAFVGLFKFKDQYGSSNAAVLASADKSGIKYTVSYVSGTTSKKSLCRVVNNGQNSAKIVFDNSDPNNKLAAGDKFTFKVIATGVDGSTKECRYTITVVSQ